MTDLTPNDIEALSFYFKNTALLDSRSSNQLQSDPEIVSKMSAGAFLIAVRFGIVD